MSFGGNIGGLNPSFSDSEVGVILDRVKYLKPGSLARVETIFWGIFWEPTSLGDFRGIDKLIETVISNKLIPIFLLAPCPHPKSGWYKNDYNDWWLPKKELWPLIFEKLDILVKRIITKMGPSKIKPMFQLHNEPSGKCINPPIGEKPGGSNATLMGEWHKDFHEFFYGIATVLKNNRIPNSSIVSPAISCIQEGNMQEISEWKSMTPPTKFNWLKYCGHKAYHLRFRAGWAKDPATRLSEVKRGFRFCVDYLDWSDKSKFTSKSQKIMLTEIYVTPGDCGCQLNDNLDEFRKVAVDLINEKGWSYTVWGLGKNESDVPGNVWFTYGGWGNFISPVINSNPTPTVSKNIVAEKNGIKGSLS